MALYSEKVMDHFRNPRNVGVIEDANAIGEVGNAKCGDIMKMYMKIEDEVIKDVKFETFGCGSAIASSSMATELIKGHLSSRAVDWGSSGNPRARGRVRVVHLMRMEAAPSPAWPAYVWKQRECGDERVKGPWWWL